MTSKLELDGLRRGIDAVDQKILQLLHERVGLVLQVGQYKREHDVKIYDPDRERDVIARLRAGATRQLNADAIQRIFERIIDEMRRIEQHHTEPEPPEPPEPT
ncbi:MAG: chorismate mutase [Myxococcales bacterium]